MESVFDQVGQTIVYADEELRIVILWNGNCTLNSYSVSEDGKWNPTDCRTLNERPHSTGHAEKEAEEWIADMNSNECSKCCERTESLDDDTCAACAERADLAEEEAEA